MGRRFVAWGKEAGEREGKGVGRGKSRKLVGKRVRG